MAKISSLPSLKNTNISAKSESGAVTLSGVVATRGLKGVATNAAKRINGVKKVINQITIEKQM